MSEFDLAKIEDFVQAVEPLWPGQTARQNTIAADGLYCVRCGGSRRMLIENIAWPGFHGGYYPMEFGWGYALFTAVCMQCELPHRMLVHTGPDGLELAVFTEERGGFSTPNTPDGVAYYLDQAHRAEQVGAKSAAAGMYRSALEMLLHEQGYIKGMLNQKIKELLADPNPRPWRDQIDSDYLEALKQIGNGSMHPNDGDVERQKVFDGEVLGMLRAVFEELLDVIYERPAKDAARKAKLQSVGHSFTQP